MKPSKKPVVLSPKDVPPERLTPLSKRFLDWKTGLMVIIGVLLVFTFLNVFVTNPTVVGYSVYNSETQDTTRLSNMTSILVVVFAFFGLFLFIITRKLGDYRQK